jgi:hypothetical protein
MSKKMIILIVALLTAFFGILFIGYYESVFDEDGEPPKKNFFIKKFPTFRVKFYNPSIMMNEARKQWGDFGTQEQIEYCKFRYGLKGSSAEIFKQCEKIEDLSPKPD